MVNLKYRAEIDGLRALAVVPVILFHAGFELFSGGFVGVDVFFVISGYLITTILIEDIENERFSIVNFYERRARRILPALFFVMLVCIPFAWMWMLPSQMQNFSQSLVAVSLFIPNILFARESGYFDATAEEKPLLHTWTLAVEEQFYIVFPIFLILAWRFGKNRVFWMIAAMTAISFFLSEWGWRNKPTVNFYLAPTRAWELFAGSIAAFIVQKRGVQKNDALSVLGLAAIVFAIFAYDERTPFPSVYALVPVLGTALLVVFANKETLAAKLLSSKALVGVGLISYSAYLWHQPLFAFARIRSLSEPTELLMLVLSILSIGLAYLSWLFVERPFRKRGAISREKIFSFSALGLIGFIAVGVAGYVSDGFQSRVDENTRKIIAVSDIGNKARDDGGCNRFRSQTEVRACTFGDIENVRVALIGDSHASSLVPSLRNYGEANEVGFVRHTKNVCPFTLGFQSTAQEDCFQYVENVLSWLKENSDVETAVISVRLAHYTSDEDYHNGLGGVEDRGDNFFGTIDTLHEDTGTRKNHGIVVCRVSKSRYYHRFAYPGACMACSGTTGQRCALSN